jgi:signal transduction histidine kinase
VSIIKITTSDLPAEAANCLAMIETSANRLSGMITKILDTEAIESKKLNLMMEPINFSSLLRSVADRYRIDAQRKNIALVNSIPNDITVVADRSYLDQVVDNLLSNAIKFSPPDRSIFINLTRDAAQARCEIKDEGPGLSEEDKSKLFSKYQKLSAKPTGNETSTGLGLSIVKKFVEAMHGKIWCESSLGEGASFFVSFPAE